MTEKENINICFLALESDSLSMDLVDMELDEQNFTSFGDAEDEDKPTDEESEKATEEVETESQESVSSKENREDTETPSSKESESESKNASSPKADVYSVTIQSLKLKAEIFYWRFRETGKLSRLRRFETLSKP